MKLTSQGWRWRRCAQFSCCLLLTFFFFLRLVHPVNLSHLRLLESLRDTRANRGSRTATVTLLVLEHSGMSFCWKHSPPDGSLTSVEGIRESYYHIHVEIICINTTVKNCLPTIWKYLDFRMNGSSDAKWSEILHYHLHWPYNLN